MDITKFPPIHTKDVDEKTPLSKKKREIFTVPKNYKRKFKPTYDPIPFTNSRWEKNLLGNWPATGRFQVENVNRGTSKSYYRRVSLQSKPRLVSELENFLRKEMEVVSSPREEYIAVRECFKRFISSFKTYVPILNHILSVFDRYVHQIESKVQVNNDSSRKYSSLQESMEVRLHLEKRKYSDDKVNLSKVVGTLQKKIDKQKHSQMLQISRIEQLERDLKDAKEDIGDERKRSSILTQALQDSSLENRSLKIKLKQAEAKVKSHSKIQKLYQNSVKRLKRLDEMVKKEQYDKLKEELIQYKNLSEKLNQQVKSLRRGTQRMTEDMLSLKLELSSKVENAVNDAKLIEKAKLELKKFLTPRPNWAAAKRLLPAFDSRLSSSAGIAKQLEDHVIILEDKISLKEEKLLDLNRILNRKERFDSDSKSSMHPINFFIGKGTHHRIPKYLRYNGKIEKKEIEWGKQKVEETLIQIWEKRKKKTFSEFPEFQDYFDDFCSKRTKSTKEKAEMVYNLIRGCERFRHDPDCELFLKVLRGDISEESYVDQDSLIENFHEFFKRIDYESHKDQPDFDGKITGFVSKLKLFEELDIFFKSKSSEDMSIIKSIIALDNKGRNFQNFDNLDVISSTSSVSSVKSTKSTKSEIDRELGYEHFFEETKDHTQHVLIETIRHQYLIEVEQFSIDLVESLYKLQIDMQGRPVTIEMIIKCFREIDPLRPSDKMYDLVNAGLERKINFSKKSKVPNDNKLKRPVNIDNFLKLMKSKCVKRYTRKVTDQDRMVQDQRKYLSRSRSRGMSKRSMFNDSLSSAVV